MNNHIIILQNTTTKQCTIYNVVDENDGSGIYYKFQIDTTNLQDGEYKLYLTDNQLTGEVVINQNNIDKTTIDGDEINIIATELVRVGNYTTTTTTYNQVRNFKTYNGR